MLLFYTHIRKKLLLFFISTLFSAHIIAQSTDSLITLKGNHYSLKTLLRELSEKKYPIVYGSNLIPDVSKIEIPKNLSFTELLLFLKTKKIIDYKKSNEVYALFPFTPKKWTLSGKLIDIDTGEDIIGATLQIGENSHLGTITNGYGYFALTIEEGEKDVIIKHLLYQTKKIKISLTSETNISIKLKQKENQLEDVIIDEQDKKVKDIKHKSIDLPQSINSLNILKPSSANNNIPFFMSEPDIIQQLLLVPGVKSYGENSSGLSIRGGGFDQNLYLVDEAPVFNINHLLGFTSIFNPDAMNYVRLMKGFIPASYGGRTSSVMEIRQKEGNNENLSLSGGFSLVSGRILAEIPIKKEKSSLLVSARNYVFGGIIKLISKNNFYNSRDYNLKFNYKINDKNKIFLSGYLGNDHIKIEQSLLKWGNRLLVARWNHLFSQKLFSNFTAYISDYTSTKGYNFPPFKYSIRSNIVNYNLKSDFTYYKNSKDEIQFGIGIDSYRLLPGERIIEHSEINETQKFSLARESSFNPYLYINRELTFKNFNIYAGLRYELLKNYRDNGFFSYRKNKIENTEKTNFFNILSPRIGLNWNITPTTSIKASYGKTSQFLHLISNSIEPQPKDIWRLSNSSIPPSIGHNFSTGVYFHLKEKWLINLDIYYKKTKNQLQLKKGVDLLFKNNFENVLEIGKGRAYGLELGIRKEIGKFIGSLNYSLSKSEVKLNNESSYKLSNFDKTHYLSTNWSYYIRPRINISLNFIYNTGVPLSLPSDKIFIDNVLIPYFPKQKKARISDYHRLDLSIKFFPKKYTKKGKVRKFKSYWTISGYNIYSRNNTNFYSFGSVENKPTIGVISKNSIFGGFIPGIAYNFKF